MATHEMVQKGEENDTYHHEKHDHGMKGLKEIISIKEVEYFPLLHSVKGDTLSKLEKGKH